LTHGNRNPKTILNVVKFNWHFYVLACCIAFILLTATPFLPENYTVFCVLISGFILIPTIISLVVTFYIYDYSKIYNLNFLNDLNIKSSDNLVNINAGFDEFSFIISDKFKTKNLHVFDFYNPSKHTEISIERARKVSKTYPNTKNIETSKLPLEANSVDSIFLLFAAHEIRNQEERIVFFQEINKKLKPNGKIIVLEHLRDLPNFIAYTIGFFHFLSKKEWRKTFLDANLQIQSETKITPFLSLFILQKNGNTT
jgi:SAM-dependent methyltransferase